MTVYNAILACNNHLSDYDTYIMTRDTLMSDFNGGFIQTDIKKLEQIFLSGYTFMAYDFSEMSIVAYNNDLKKLYKHCCRSNGDIRVITLTDYLSD